MTDLTPYYLQWRGGKQGPWSLAAIQAALRSGEIHSMYQIEVAGQWLPLRDFLESRQAKGWASSPSTEPQATSPAPNEPCRQSPSYSPELRTEFPQTVRTDHMEWRHVGIAVLMLLGIAAGGFGSCAIVKAVAAPAGEAKTASDSR